MSHPKPMDDGGADLLATCSELVRILDITGFGYVSGWAGGQDAALEKARAAIADATLAARKETQL